MLNRSLYDSVGLPSEITMIVLAVDRSVVHVRTRQRLPELSLDS